MTWRSWATRKLGQPLPAHRWGNVSQPTLVATGAKSEAFFHQSAEALVALLPDARHYRLPKANHSAVAASPKRVAEMILGLVRHTVGADLTTVRSPRQGCRRSRS